MTTFTPSALVPTSVTSIDASIGAPTSRSVTPYPASTSRWPSAVAPPWLPMAGTITGSAPRARSHRTSVAAISPMRSTPRLPMAKATRLPFHGSDVHV